MPNKPIVAKKKYSTGMKLLMAAGITAAAVFTFISIATLVYWTPQLIRSSDLMEHGAVASGKYVEGAQSFIPYMAGRSNSIRQSVVAYTVDGEEFTTTTSERVGGHYRDHKSSITMYYDTEDPSIAVSKYHLDFSRTQVIVGALALAGALAIAISRLVVVMKKRKATS